MNFLNKNARYTENFIIISVVQYFVVFLAGWGGFPLSDFVYSSAVYIVALLLQSALVLFFHKKLRNNKLLFVFYVSLIFLNSFFFIFLVTSWSKIFFFIYCFFCLVIYFSACARSDLSYTFILSFLQIFLFSVNILVNKVEGVKLNNVLHQKIDPQKYKKNIYIVGIDGMISRDAMLKIFDEQESIAYRWLEQNEFKLYDIISPGDQTLTTYGNLLTGGELAHPRNVRGIINGSVPSEFYRRMKSAGYSRQFFFETDYLGRNAGMLESFYPASHTFSFCNFTDKRWGYYFCFLNDIFFAENSAPNSVSQKIKFFKDRANISSEEKWVSIHHIWYPGHTLGQYDGANSSDFNDFKRYYMAAQAELKNLFFEIYTHIIRIDPDPVIIFFGDHGSFALRSKKDFLLPGYDKNAMQDVLFMDARSALLAVYPQDFCSGRINPDKTSNLFLLFQECLQEY